MSDPRPDRPRRRRRAVGPPGAVPADRSTVEVPLEAGSDAGAGPADDDDRLRRDRPPHHDRGV